MTAQVDPLGAKLDPIDEAKLPPAKDLLIDEAKLPPAKDPPPKSEEAGDIIGTEEEIIGRVVADVVPVTGSEVLGDVGDDVGTKVNVGEVAGDEVVGATGVVVAGAVA